jgi:hypothetical protein
MPVTGAGLGRCPRRNHIDLAYFRPSRRELFSSAVSRENSVTFAGDQLNEAGTAAQTRADVRGSLELDQLNYLGGFLHSLVTDSLRAL